MYNTTWKYGIMKDLHDVGLRKGCRCSLLVLFEIVSLKSELVIGTQNHGIYDKEAGVPQLRICPFSYTFLS